MPKLKSLVKSIVRQPVLYFTKARLKKLRNIPSPAGPLFAEVLENSDSSNLASSEKDSIRVIEQIRSELASSTDSVNMIDYGVDLNDPDSKEADSKTYTRSVAEITNDSKEPFWALLLYNLVRKFRPKTVLEMGTSLGFSAAYMGLALQQNDRGRLITLEGDPSIAELAESNFKKAQLTNTQVIIGKFQDTLPGALADHAPLDMVFIDGHHDGPATVAYFEQILPYLSDEAVLVFDDIRWSDSMQKAIHRISSHEAVNLTLDLRGMAMCYFNRHETERHTVYLPLI